MTSGDFRHNERFPVTVEAATTVRIEHCAADGSVTLLKGDLALQAGEIIDGTFMSVSALKRFLAEQVSDAKAQGVLKFAAHEGDHDEGLRPDHLWPRREAPSLRRCSNAHGATLRRWGSM